MKSRRTRVIGALAALIVFAVLVVRFQDRKAAPRAPGDDESSRMSQAPTSGVAMARTEPAAPPRASTPDPDADAGDGVAAGLPREKIEEYLTRHQRGAASLLAAFHASSDGANGTGDIQYLKEAATHFPWNPHVQWTVLAHDVFPEDRRKWLDAFKASSPDNSVGNYLSAREHFKNRQPEAAIEELREASGKSEYADFAMESYLGVEEVFRELERTPLEAHTAAMSAMSADLLPQLSNMREIARDIVAASKRDAGSGDSLSPRDLSRMGLQLADRLTRGEGGRFLISRVTGEAMESMVLKSLDPDVGYDFLGGQTTAQRLEGLRQQRQDLRALMQDFQGAFLGMSPDERVSFVERVKVYGEVPALRWLQERAAATRPPK